MRRLFRIPWRGADRIREDMDEEIGFHLDMRTAELASRGLEPREARERAEREFGDLDAARRGLRGDDERLERRARWSEAAAGFLRDARFAGRALGKRPGFSGLAVLTIALGIGATTLVFSVVDGVLLRPLPYPDSDRLVDVWQTNRAWLDSDNPMLRGFARRFPASYPVYEDWRTMVRSFDAVGVYASDDLTVTGADRPERLSAIRATAGLFDALGVSPALGRGIAEAEDRLGGPTLAVLGDGLWRRLYGGDPDVLGETLSLEGTTYTIVGVMPPDFYFPDPESELWLTLDDEVRESGRRSQGLRAIARLADGVDIETARSDLDAVTARIAETHPETQAQLGARLAPRVDEVVGHARASLMLLLLAAGLVLLVACANVMNMLFVRATTRGREIVVRAALGAGRGRIARSLMAESLILAVLGGIVGTLLAVLLFDPLIALLPASVPRAHEVALDGRVLGFAAAATVAAAVLAGAIPALLAARTRLAGALQSTARTLGGGRGAGRLRSALVVAELAVAVVLLVTAGLLGRSLVRLSAVDPGFDADGVVLAELAVPQSAAGEPAAVRALYEALRDRAAAIPGVLEVGFAENTPFVGGSSSGTVELERGDGELVTDNVGQAVVSDGYFEAFRVPLLRGRTFRATDHEDAAPVVVISRAMAERHWPDADPIGQRLRDPSEQQWRTVIGVVADVRHGSLAQPPGARAYRPIAQAGELEDGRLIMALRTADDPGGLALLLRSAVWEVAPTMPIPRVVLLADAVSESIAEPRFRALLIGALALLAAMLAVAGVYALVAFTVARRTHEMGVRMALGASPARLTGEVVMSGLWLGAAGLLIGVPAALAAARLVRGFLFEVSAADPLILAIAAAAVVGTVALAAYLPARRAAAVDPTAALRAE